MEHQQIGAPYPRQRTLTPEESAKCSAMFAEFHEAEAARTLVQAEKTLAEAEQIKAAAKREAEDIFLEAVESEERTHRIAQMEAELAKEKILQEAEQLAGEIRAAAVNLALEIKETALLEAQIIRMGTLHWGVEILQKAASKARGLLNRSRKNRTGRPKKSGPKNGGLPPSRFDPEN